MDLLKGLKGGGMGNMMQMLQQVQNFKQKFAQMKAEAEAKYFEAEAGGDRVKVRITGVGVVDSVSIAPELIQTADSVVLEGLVQTAVNEALEKVKDNLKAELSKAAGDMQLPGM